MELKLKEQLNDLGMTGSTTWYELKAQVESDKPDEILFVEYYLEDPSISSPVMVSGSSYNNFEIQAQSWKDNVPVTAKITFKDSKLVPVTLTKSNPIQLTEA